MTTPQAEQIHETVRAHYGRLAEAADLVKDDCGCNDNCCETGVRDNDCGCNDSCCTSSMEVTDLPEEISGFSLGCGDPVTLANLEPGQTVLDLGSGGGLDCFVAARQVGPSGQVIGVDMTPAMLEKAERNRQTVGLANVEFRQGQIEALPVADDTVDVIISNCVINLSPDKPAVFREALRVLRPGGRLAVSDIVTQGHFSPAERADLNSWAGCVSGAEDIGDLVRWMEQVGFTEISIRDKDAPEVELAGTLSLPGAARVFSARITARKPLTASSQQYFAGVAGQWDEIRAGFFTEAMRDDAIARAALPAGAVVADVGTGTGFVLTGLAGKAARLVGFDQSAEMLTVARQNLAAYEGIELYEAEGERLPAEDNSFDAVFANMYLHHAPDPAATIKEMVRILKPGGRLVITDLDSHEQAWMREAMADRWLGFNWEQVQKWYEAAGLTDVVVDCAAGTCDCDGPTSKEISLSVFVAIGTKRG